MKIEYMANQSGGLSGLKRLSKIQINKDVLLRNMKTDVKGSQRQRCLDNNDSSGSSMEVDERTWCCHDAAFTMRVWTLLKKQFFSVAASQVIRSSVNDHEITENIDCPPTKRTR